MQERRYAQATTRITHDVLDGEVLVIEESTGTYYSMSGTAATVWVVIGDGRSVDAIADAVGTHHATDADRVRPDIDAYLDELLTNGLIVLSDTAKTSDTPGDAPSLGSIPAVPWETPVLGKFTDMRDLLMFDPVHEVDTSGWPNVER